MPTSTRSNKRTMCRRRSNIDSLTLNNTIMIIKLVVMICLHCCCVAPDCYCSALSSSSSNSKNTKKPNKQGGFQFPSFSSFELPNFDFDFGDGSSSSSSSSSSSKIKVPEIQDQQVLLENGISAQVLSCIPRSSLKSSTSRKKPPLVFLHGSFHAAWCWSERFFPYFASKGYPCVALSWRGTGGTPAGDGVKKVKSSEHCDDLQCFLNKLPEILHQSAAQIGNDQIKPILISHSFGGIVVMKYLEELSSTNQKKVSSISDQFAGIISMCSVPPSGNGKMTMRFLKRSWKQSYQITIGFAMKKACTDPKLCRQLFFGGDQSTTIETEKDDDLGISDDDIQRYQSYFTRDTQATIDLLDLAKKLPSRNVDEDGRAPFFDQLPPCLVIGAKDDYIVDLEGNIETAKYYGLTEPIYVDSPHDIMLGSKWQNCADTIDKWIQENVV